MKQIILTFLIVLISASIKAQYGADGVVGAAGHAGIWATTKKDWDELMDGQQLLIFADVTMALEQAKLTDISKKRYKSKSKLDEGIENSKVYAQIALHGEKLFTTQGNIWDLTEEYPLVRAAISPAFSELVLEQLFLLEDVLTAKEKEGQGNLMNSSERLIYILSILQKIKNINKQAVALQIATGKLIALRDMDLSTPAEIQFSVDQSEAIQAFEEQLNKLIID